MSFQPTAAQVIELSRKTNLPMMKIKAAMVKLGHCDERLVIGYINACGLAVVRKKRDENGNLVRMTDDDLAEQFKL
jgi:translation elongation factor EF-Ts